MKKLLSIILSLTLMLSMSVFASAYDSESVSYNINGELVTCLLYTSPSPRD